MDQLGSIFWNSIYPTQREHVLCVSIETHYRSEFLFRFFFFKNYTLLLLFQVNVPYRLQAVKHKMLCCHNGAHFVGEYPYSWNEFNHFKSILFHWLFCVLRSVFVIVQYSGRTAVWNNLTASWYIYQFPFLTRAWVWSKHRQHLNTCTHPENRPLWMMQENHCQ